MTSPPRWNASWLSSRPPEERTAFLNSLSPAERQALSYHWTFWARENQLPPPGEWRTLLILAGRGWGKTRCGAEWVRAQAEAGVGRIALVGRTAADARDVMVEGESGLLSVCPPWYRPKFEPTKRRVTWPRHRKTGVSPIAGLYSGDQPDQLRGPQHGAAWCDELAAWRYPEAFAMLQFGLRLGADPRLVVTTTPRPVPHLRELLAAETTRVVRGSTYENRGHLAPAFLEKIVCKYEGTRLGRQELNAELLEDNPLALWQRGPLEALRVPPALVPDLERVVVAVDPSVHDGAALETDAETAAEAGIVVAGVGRLRGERHAFVLADCTVFGSPLEWARAAVAAFTAHRADRVVAETNQGGAMVELTLRTVDRSLPYRGVHATRGKRLRAEPVSALYEQGRVHHVGCFPALEDELCEWVPGSRSPNRLDALVWAITDLLLEDAPDAQFAPSIW